MRGLILIELIVVFVTTAVFVALYAFRSSWWSPTGRLVMAWAVISLAESGLFALSYAVRVPLWVFAAIFGATGLIALRRLWLLLRAQRNNGLKDR